MKTEQGLDLFLSTIIREGLYPSKGNLKFHMDMVFGGIDLKNKRVLDIGGGFGLYSFYAACSGARKVVCLEPEAEGSSLGVTDRFHKLNGLLRRGNVALKPVTLQAFKFEGKLYDIILLHNSINHLDETACINLQKSSNSKGVYREIFSKIYSLSNKGAKLIICDCSRYNFFASLKIRNPFAPSIGWHKHQEPEIWVKLLVEAGFVDPKIKWTSFNTLRNWGRVLTGNKLMAYFLTSHFCLTMDKP